MYTFLYALIHQN